MMIGREMSSDFLHSSLVNVDHDLNLTNMTLAFAETISTEERLPRGNNPTIRSCTILIRS